MGTVSNKERSESLLARSRLSFFLVVSEFVIHSCIEFVTGLLARSESRSREECVASKPVTNSIHECITNSDTTRKKEREQERERAKGKARDSKREQGKKGKSHREKKCVDMCMCVKETERRKRACGGRE